MADKGMAFLSSKLDFYKFMACLYTDSRGDITSLENWVDTFCTSSIFLDKEIEECIFHNIQNLEKYIEPDFIPEEYPTFIVFDLYDTSDLTSNWSIVPIRTIDIIEIKSRIGDNIIYFEDL